MSFGPQLPLGQRIPDSVHAVSVSIPTLEDVVGYEERRPATMAKLKSGYPRFIKHEYLLQIEERWKELFDRPDHSIWLTSSERVARELEAYLSHPKTKYLAHGGVSGLSYPPDTTLDLLAKRYLQHIGGHLSTRHAEDYLVAQKALPSRFLEESFEGDAAAKVLDHLAPLYKVSSPESIALAYTGMSAIYAAFRAVNDVQVPKGRRSWIKLGWLYTDTMHILDKLSPENSDNLSVYQVLNLEQLETTLKQRPDDFAGLITECPTNPLIQTPDLERIRELATKYGFYLILDPTINSPANVDVSPYADIITNSLTKYAGNQGDTILGATAVLDRCPEKEAILAKIHQYSEAPYPRDLQRLAAQIDGYAALIAKTNASTRKVVEYLKAHPAIKRVYWAHQPCSKTQYEAIARSPEAVGGVISFELKGELKTFHDRVRLPKGPSFGMQSSLLSPFIWLAHYELTTNQEGLAYLAAAGIPKDLIRFSIGAEPAEEIIAALAEAL
ncbi:MAG: PLP-dependent transferase [Symploca sp. SIO2D2]|nr:PLP-dependent transferase [Symploca sp. SIO2D2]